MTDYCTSEKLFLDIWEEYGCPNEVYDKGSINKILDEIVKKSNTHVVLDHYSQINFDYISKIESKDRYTLIYWFDKNNYREKYLKKELSESELLEWSLFGYATYEYVLLDIAKIKFVKEKNHLFILIMSNLVRQKEIEKYILEDNEYIGTEVKTADLYTQYAFFEGNSENLIKHFCIVGNLPYYTCVIQPKENIPDTGVSKMILLRDTLREVEKRLGKARNRLYDTEDNDFDGLCSVGNTIRRILEYVLKYYCVTNEIDLEGLHIEQKYGYIELGGLKKVINKTGKLNISQTLVDMANNLSHDSGIAFSKKHVLEFYLEVVKLLNQIIELISKNC